uniref:Uncharacterized protein n=1 Tax=Anguilla anguilla TaxID=7936 RepID=A0A0E9V269_ANGAN
MKVIIFCLAFYYISVMYLYGTIPS